MAMMKGALVGAALGALGLGTVLFVAPIAAQGPTGSVPGPDRGRSGPAVTGEAAPRMPDAPGMRSQRRDGDRDMGAGGGRQPIDPNDPDITGPRGDYAVCLDRLERMAQMRLDRIQRLTRPTDEQRPAFEELKIASNKGLDTLRQACPSEQPLTPPARMVAMEKWLEARLQASKTVRPALEAYYRLLSDEQKIRWSLGPRESRFGADTWERQPTPARPDIRPPSTRPAYPPSGAEERGRGADERGREPDGWRGPRRGAPDMFDERRDSRDGRDGRFGFERGDRGERSDRGDRDRGDRGAERFRWRDDDRGGWDDRWSEQDRGRRSDPWWRDQRRRDD